MVAGRTGENAVMRVAGRTWEQQKGWQQAELENSKKDGSRQNLGAERMAAGSNAEQK